MINLLWALGAIGKLAVSGSLARRGLLRSHAVLVAFLLITLLKSAVLASLSDPKIYKLWWIKLQPVDLVLGALLALEAIRRIAAHFPNSTRFATYTTLIFGIVSVAVVLGTSDLLAPYRTGALYGMVHLTRQWTLACLLVTGLTIGFYGRTPGQWAPNTRRYLAGLVVMFALELIGAGTWRYDYKVGKVILTLAPIAACLFWMRMSEKGEASTRFGFVANLRTEVICITTFARTRAVQAGLKRVA